MIRLLAGLQDALSSIRLWIYVAAMALRIPTMGQSLTVWHGWRQTQTAYKERIFQTEGIDLLRPQVPVFGRPFVLVYELPLFQAMASGVASLGVGLEHALRWTSLFWFAVTALLLGSILVRIAGRRVAVAAELVFLFNPFGLFWSRASLIEYLATALALACILAALRWRDGGSRATLLTAVVLGGIGSMVKATSMMVWMLPMAALLVIPTGIVIEARMHRLRRQRARFIGFGAIALVVLAAGLAWSAWADRVKGASPLTVQTKTGSVLAENRAAWPHLTTWKQWAKPFDMVVNHQLGGIVVLAAVLLALHRTDRKLWWWSLALMPPVAVLAFPVQYLEHEYYNAAVSPAVAALAGLAAVTLVDSAWTISFFRLTRPIVLVPVWMALAAVNGYQSIALLRLANSNPVVQAELKLPRELLAHTEPSELIGGIGLLAWSPVPFYEANRRGAIMTFPDQSPQYAQEFRTGKYHAILVGHPRQDDLRVLDGWAWIGSVSPHILRFGDNQTFVALAPVVAASIGPRGWVEHTSVLQGSSSLPCDGSPLRLPSTPSSIGVWFTKPDEKQHFWVNDRFAALPVRNVAVITAEALGVGQQRALRCQGGGSLEIAQITTFPSLEGPGAGI